MMNREKTDDPRQVLAILNSLGVIGVTASELKAFMKELKLYRKVKEKECQQWKQKVRTKILQEINIENKEVNLYKSRLVENRVSKSKESTRKANLEKTHNYLQFLCNKKNHDFKEKENFNSKQNLSAPIITKYSNTSPSYKYIQELIKVPLENSKKLLCSNGNTEKINDYQVSHSGSKTCTSSIRKKSNNLYCRSKSCVYLYNCLFSTIFTNSINKKQYTLFSVIRSTNSHSQLNRTESVRKMMNDPVALYNKYKSLWTKLSLPGEENHAKLRWTVREKMLGSNPIPKPNIPYKKMLQMSSKDKKQ